MRNLLAASLVFVSLSFHLPHRTVAEDIELIKTISVPGNLLDKSGLSELVDSSYRHDLFGGISSLEYTGNENLYLALADRGPKDGVLDWSCRFHLVEINVAGESAIDFAVRKTLVLKRGEKVFSGLSTRYQESDQKMFRMDPEGIRLSANGLIWVSDEYGPHVLAFNSEGQWVGELKLPQRFRIATPGKDKIEENQNNNSGRQGNRGMEGLAIGVTNGRIFGLMQSPLLQDSQRDVKNKPTGLDCRLIEIDQVSNQSREFLYRLDNSKNKLNEILAISDNEFLVIERDGRIGDNAEFKKIIKIDLSPATEIQDVESLAPGEKPQDLVPIAKEVFIDLLDPKFGLVGESLPEKIESLAFGPKLSDGRQTLLVVSDNDFITDQPTRVYCFAINATEIFSNSATTR